MDFFWCNYLCLFTLWRSWNSYWINLVNNNSKNYHYFCFFRSSLSTNRINSYFIIIIMCNLYQFVRNAERIVLRHCFCFRDQIFGLFLCLIAILTSYTLYNLILLSANQPNCHLFSFSKIYHCRYYDNLFYYYCFQVIANGRMVDKKWRQIIKLNGYFVYEKNIWCF